MAARSGAATAPAILGARATPRAASETKPPPVFGKGLQVTLEDGFGRRFRYVRLSVTEACNFRCSYCLPQGYRKSGPQDFLSVAEISRLARALVKAGIGKLRLTGGEPSVRRDLAEIIAVGAAAGAGKIALTTNGWSLRRDLAYWRAAGLTHLNVSVDSFEPRVFERLTGHDKLADILAGVEQALAGDLASVKLNAVLLRSTTGEGFERAAAYLRDRPLALRYIELMRTGDNAAYFAAEHLPGSALTNWLAARGWRPLPRGGDDGPALEYSHPDFAGRFGLIAPYAPGFCDSCNRLRVTARGVLRLCLFGEGGVDLRDLLQSDGDQAQLLERLAASLGAKAAGHRLREGVSGDARHLAQMGG